MGHIKEDVSYLERWVTQTKRVKLGKMDHTYKNGSHLEKWVSVKTMGHT